MAGLWPEVVLHCPPSASTVPTGDTESQLVVTCVCVVVVVVGVVTAVASGPGPDNTFINNGIGKRNASKLRITPKIMALTNT